MARIKKAHMPHKPSQLGIWLNGLPQSRWLYPLHAARRLYLVEHEISLPNLPRPFAGLRVAYMSDIHYGAFLDASRLGELAERLNELEADLIILGGDYGEDAVHTFRFWKKLPRLHARLAVCGVLGNHDRAEAGSEALAGAMYRRGVIPLVNNALYIAREGARLAVCATDDYNHGNPDFAGVAEQVKDADFVIFAPHSPDALLDAYAVGPKPFFQLALCGHTHGGQIAPFGLAPYTSSRHGWRYGNRYRTGEIDDDGVTVIVSNGVGASWLPIRLGAPPQYHLITLHAVGSRGSIKADRENHPLAGQGSSSIT